MNYPWHAAPDLLAPARRASLMMFLIGGFLLLGGLCMGVAGALFDQFPAEQREEIDKKLEAQGLDFKTQAVTMAVVMGTPGLALFVLAFFVRRGGFGSAVTAMVVASILAMLAGLSLVGNGLQAVSGNSSAALEACMMLGLLSALTLLIIFLVQALRAASQAAVMRSHFQQPMWPYAGQPPMHPQGFYPPPMPMSPPASPPNYPPPQDQRKPPDGGPI